MKKRYEVGLEKLATTESSVADMQQELIALQPQLEVSTKETEAAMVVSTLLQAWSSPNLNVARCFTACMAGAVSMQSAVQTYKWECYCAATMCTSSAAL